MALKTCPVCDMDFKNGDDVAATVLSKFVDIASDVNFAIDHPYKCLELVHSECLDWTEFDDDN